MSNATGFQEIPGVGKKMCLDFIELGYSAPDDLIGESPEEMYENIMALRGMHVDRCVLYVYRCAVYFVSNTTHDPELLQWWSWKDENITK